MRDKKIVHTHKFYGWRNLMIWMFAIFLIDMIGWTVLSGMSKFEASASADTRLCLVIGGEDSKDGCFRDVSILKLVSPKSTRTVNSELTRDVSSGGGIDYFTAPKSNVEFIFNQDLSTEVGAFETLENSVLKNESDNEVSRLRLKPRVLVFNDLLVKEEGSRVKILSKDLSLRGVTSIPNATIFVSYSGNNFIDVVEADSNGYFDWFFYDLVKEGEYTVSFKSVANENHVTYEKIYFTFDVVVSKEELMKDDEINITIPLAQEDDIDDIDILDNQLYRMAVTLDKEVLKTEEGVMVHVDITPLQLGQSKNLKVNWFIKNENGLSVYKDSENINMLGAVILEKEFVPTLAVVEGVYVLEVHLETSYGTFVTNKTFSVSPSSVVVLPLLSSGFGLTQAQQLTLHIGIMVALVFFGANVMLYREWLVSKKINHIDVLALAKQGLLK